MNLAAGVEGSSPLLNISIFAVFVLVTLVIVFRASRNTKTASDYYAAGRAFSGPQNGIAISGDYLSAASFLGIAGAIALYGYDGFLYSIGFLVAWLVALLLVAELLRNSGRFTMADQLAFRMKQKPVRTAAATSTIVVSIFYLLAQMVGAGSLGGLLLRAALGAVGDRPDRRVLPDDAGARVRRRGAAEHRQGFGGRGVEGQRRVAAAGRVGRRWRRVARRGDPAGADRGGRVRDDPRGG